tara:strand:+ start:2644 stop:3243 length:600 start_codon:yes stop_codon:yes gene_type:complete
MTTVRQIRSSGERELIIFDIDDTLFHTTAQISVLDTDGKVMRTLTNQQFNTFKLPAGWSFDFGEFRNAKIFAKESTPIKPMINRLKKLMVDSPSARFVFLTARENFDDKALFLDTFKKQGIDMSRVFVHRAGNLTGGAIPALKVKIVSGHLDSRAYDKVQLFDDAPANLKAFLKMRKAYKWVTFTAFLVKANGSVKEIK